MSESQSPAPISEFVRQSAHLASAGRTSCFSERIGESWTVGWVLVLSLPCVALFASFTSLNSHFLSIQWRWHDLPLRFLSRTHEVIDVGFFFLGGGRALTHPTHEMMISFACCSLCPKSSHHVSVETHSLGLATQEVGFCWPYPRMPRPNDLEFQEFSKPPVPRL